MGSPCELSRRRRGRCSGFGAAGADASDAFAAGFGAADFAADGLGVLSGVAFFAVSFVGASFGVDLRASRTLRRLAGPRTGARNTKTHPTLATGLPPIN